MAWNRDQLDRIGQAEELHITTCPHRGGDHPAAHRQLINNDVHVAHARMYGPGLKLREEVVGVWSLAP